MFSIFQFKFFRVCAGGTWVNYNGGWFDVKDLYEDDGETYIKFMLPDWNVPIVVNRMNSSVHSVEEYDE